MTEKLETGVRLVKPRKWASASVAGAAVGLMMAGQVEAAVGKTTGASMTAPVWLAAATEGGEGGEGGAAPVAENDSVSLLVGLAKIEAHILTGLDLLAIGQTEASHEQIEAAEHEFYPSLEAALEAHKAPAFEDSLEALDAASAKAAKPEDLGAAHDAVKAGIEAARQALAPTAKDELAAVLALTREAAEDFAKGVKDGAIAELGEYQDARAYVLSAREVLARLAASEDPVVVKAAQSSDAALEGVSAALKDVAPGGAVSADEALIMAAAASIELASYPVK